MPQNSQFLPFLAVPTQNSSCLNKFVAFWAVLTLSVNIDIFKTSTGINHRVHTLVGHIHLWTNL
jgi:hypothetical protein